MSESVCQQNIWELRGSLLSRQLRRAQAVKNMLDHTNAQLVLDIGCAEGFVTSFLSGKLTYVVGIELDEESIKIAKQRVKNADFTRASITHLPFRDKCFEAITLLEVLEHLPDPILKNGIKEVDRVLRMEGFLIISVPYKEQITYTRCIHCGKLTPLWGHLRSMDEERVTTLLPNYYILTDSLHLPNVALVSLTSIFEKFPFKLWLLLNNLLGKLRKGYWLLLKYKKA